MYTNRMKVNNELSNSYFLGTSSEMSDYSFSNFYGADLADSNFEG